MAQWVRNQRWCQWCLRLRMKDISFIIKTLCQRFVGCSSLLFQSPKNLADVCSSILMPATITSWVSFGVVWAIIAQDSIYMVDLLVCTNLRIAASFSSSRYFLFIAALSASSHSFSCYWAGEMPFFARVSFLAADSFIMIRRSTGPTNWQFWTPPFWFNATRRKRLWTYYACASACAISARDTPTTTIKMSFSLKERVIVLCTEHYLWINLLGFLHKCACLLSCVELRVWFGHNVMENF